MNVQRKLNTTQYNSKSINTSTQPSAFSSPNNLQTLVDTLQNNRVNIDVSSYQTSQYNSFVQDRYQFNPTQYDVNTIATQYFNGNVKKALYFLLSIQ